MSFDIGEQVQILTGIRTGQTGPVENIAGKVYFVRFDGVGTRPYYADELAPAVKTNKLSTKWVFRNLDKDVGGRRDAWEKLIGRNTSLADFRKHASRWLRDHSELKSKTIETADWQEIYNWYRSQLG